MPQAWQLFAPMITGVDAAAAAAVMRNVVTAVVIVAAVETQMRTGYPC